MHAPPVSTFTFPFLFFRPLELAFFSSESGSEFSTPIGEHYREKRTGIVHRIVWVIEFIFSCTKRHAISLSCMVLRSRYINSSIGREQSERTCILLDEPANCILHLGHRHFPSEPRKQSIFLCLFPPNEMLHFCWCTCLKCSARVTLIVLPHKAHLGLHRRTTIQSNMNMWCDFCNVPCTSCLGHGRRWTRRARYSDARNVRSR